MKVLEEVWTLLCALAIVYVINFPEGFWFGTCRNLLYISLAIYVLALLHRVIKWM